MEQAASAMKAIDRARRGDVRAIEAMMARKLQAKKIAVAMQLDHRGLLEVRLDCKRSLPEEPMIDWLRRWFKALKAPMVQELRVYAWRPGQRFPAWIHQTTIEVPSAAETAAIFRAGPGSPSASPVSTPTAIAPDPEPPPVPFPAGNDGGAGTLDLAGVPEADRLAYYGALYAIAHADGEIDERESAAIAAIVDLSGLSPSARDQLESYRHAPPPLVACLARLAEADESLRFGLMVNLVDTSWANEELDPMELAALKLAQRSLNISDTEMQTIEGVVREMRALEDRPFGAFASFDLGAAP
jgi:uncharacterized tellurite resistance protein B-like protein